MRKLKCIVFDFDGTLVDSNKIKKDAFIHIASRYRGEAIMSKILNQVQGNRYQIMTAFSLSMDIKKSINSLVREYGEYTDIAVTNAEAFPGAESLLKTLHDSGRMVVLSSATPINNLMTIIKYRGWERWFSGIYGSPSTKLDNLQKLVSQEMLGVDEFVVVGDGEDDFNSAKSIGCNFFPVGQVRGVLGNNRIYKLTDLLDIFLNEEIDQIKE
jgi:phosphoglycolate phosphatase-like HAD superfamily hydrolase